MWDYFVSFSLLIDNLESILNMAFIFLFSFLQWEYTHVYRLTLKGNIV